MITLYFKKPGLQTTIQDQGRTGYAAFGVPVSGVMDKKAAKLANWLVGNPLDSPVLEITFMGPHIEIEGGAQLAITGANISPTLDGRQLPLNETISIEHHGLLTFGRLVNGCRTYLAVHGHWQLEKWMGSYSAMAIGGRGTTPQSVIQKGSKIHIHPSSFINKRKLSLEDIPLFPSDPTIRVTSGPEFTRLSREEIARLFGTTYHISRDSNRMGYRLEGSKISENQEREIISSGIVPGTIQLTKSGQPVILMADAQTTGGYYRVANVITPDMDILGQLKPGDSLRFEWVSFEEAIELDNVYQNNFPF